MGAGLGVMFLGLSVLAGAHARRRPFEEGTPTVISQIGRLVYGGGAVGHVLFYSPPGRDDAHPRPGRQHRLRRLPPPGRRSRPATASCPASCTKRGHRLVFSNGILVLAGAAIAPGRSSPGPRSTTLIPLYAIGVFTGFTLSQAGMAKHHLRLQEPGWRNGPVDQRHRGLPVGRRRW